MAGKLLAVLLVAFAMAAMAGCAGDSGTVPEQDGQGRYVIHATADNRFDPQDARVPVGSTVVWMVDGGAHDVSAEDMSFWSGKDRPKDAQGFPMLLQEGDTFTHTFNETGTWVYWCHTHHEQDMQGTITVD